MLLAAAMLALSAGQAQDEAIVVRTTRWAPFISPMGEPYRPQSDGENTLATWFNRTDSNHDGSITAAEMEADAMRFFTSLDEDQDGGIDPTEMNAYEWDVVRDVQVTTKRKPNPGENVAEIRKTERRQERDPRHDWRDERQGAARYTLLNMPQPVAAADADFNRLVTAAEFRAAAAARFTLLDKDGTGRLTMPQLGQMLAEANSKKRQKHSKEEDRRDTRVANPMPTKSNQP